MHARYATESNLLKEKIFSRLLDLSRMEEMEAAKSSKHPRNLIMGCDLNGV